MVRPIAALGEVATQIAAGNLTRRVTEGVHLQDEVGELVRNFNQMAARLAESREEMERLYEGLEDKVRERTAALEKANLRLQELDRLKSHFLAAVSHELHSPLTSIKAYAEILLDAPSPDPTTRMRFLEIINLETDRLTRLINELLDLARIEAGAAVWRMEPCDLGATLRAAASALAGWAAEKDLTLEVAGSTPQTVRADPDRMQQVATNLIANAIRFCPSGGTIRAWLEETSWSGPGQRRPGRYVKVAVQDTGPGLPPEEAERVFEKFYQAGSEKPGAAGLGLAISREIVVHHGGEIWVESEPGRGSTFYFTAPLVESDAQEGSA
jgi:signal transduction histidine kinase